MKLQIMSDLHLAVWGRQYGYGWFQEFLPSIKTDADVLILAGDIVDFRSSDVQWSLARLAEFGALYKHVVFVPGNHESWGTSIQSCHTRLDKAELEIPGLHVLQPGKVLDINGQRFLGATGWQPSEEDGHPVDSRRVADYETEAPYQFRKFYEFLEDDLRSDDVVVTHHAPSKGSLADEWVGHPCNRYFITHEFEQLIIERQPKLWAHGHVHTAFDYKLGATRVICNPMGYVGEGVRFEPKLVVEV